MTTQDIKDLISWLSDYILGDRDEENIRDAMRNRNIPKDVMDSVEYNFFNYLCNGHYTLFGIVETFNDTWEELQHHK